MRHLSLALVLGLTATSASQAALIAYEGFSPSGSLVNVVGTGTGSGFSGNWADSVGSGTINRTNDNTGIPDFPSNVPFANPTGGTARNAGASFADNSVTRGLNTTLDLGSNGSFYLSFLYNDFAPNTSAANREATVFLGSASQRLHVGVNYGFTSGSTTVLDSVAITRNNATNEPFVSATQRTVGTTAYLGQTGTPLLFIVAEFITQAVGNDTINLKAYSFSPGGGTVDLSPGSVVWDVTQSFNGSGTLDRLGIYMEGDPAQTPEVDEIRLGQTWFDVTGLGLPEVAVSGNSIDIADGDAVPSLADFTDFGTTAVGSPVQQTFRVDNSGPVALNTSALTLPTGFSLIEGLSASIGAGLFDTFTVQLDALAVGTYSGNISFTNNDSNENPFNFAITGNVIPAPAALPAGLAVLGLVAMRKRR